MSSWEENARQLLLEYDDDLFFGLILAVLLDMEEEKMPVHTSSLPGAVHEASEVEAQSVPSVTSTWPGSGKKRKQSQIAAVLDGYLAHKKIQSEKTMEALLEKRAYEEEYSVEKCLDTADAMEELTDEEKAIAAEVFENDMNRQMFMKQKNLNVRLIWLRRKISRLASV